MYNTIVDHPLLPLLVPETLLELKPAVPIMCICKARQQWFRRHAPAHAVMRLSCHACSLNTKSRPPLHVVARQPVLLVTVGQSARGCAQRQFCDDLAVVSRCMGCHGNHLMLISRLRQFKGSRGSCECQNDLSPSQSLADGAACMIMLYCDIAAQAVPLVAKICEARKHCQYTLQMQQVLVCGATVWSCPTQHNDT